MARRSMEMVRIPKNREEFLSALAEYGSVRAACMSAGISRDAVYRWREDEEDFAAAWDEAVVERRDAGMR